MSLPVMAAKRSGRKESQEMVTLCRPASFRGMARRSSVAPLVVIESSTGSRASRGHQFGQVSADRGFAARHADRRYAEAFDEDPGQPLDLLERKDLGPWEPAHVLVRHAVRAAEVAAVRDRYPQVVDLAAETVG